MVKDILVLMCNLVFSCSLRRLNIVDVGDAVNGMPLKWFFLLQKWLPICWYLQS